MYYAGENPNWPLESLTADYRFVIDQMEYLINDKKGGTSEISSEKHRIVELVVEINLDALRDLFDAAKERFGTSRGRGAV